MNDNIEVLKDKTIHAIYISACHCYIRFETDQGSIGFETEGDCCSDSWINDFTGVDALLGQRVLEVEIVDMPDIPEAQMRGGQEVESQYGVRFKTAKGIADLVYRNASNGYYSGYMTSNAATEADIAITKDWSADEASV